MIDKNNEAEILSWYSDSSTKEEKLVHITNHINRMEQLKPPEEKIDVFRLINAIERSLYSRIDDSIPEYRLAVGVIRQAIMDYCSDDSYLSDPIYSPKEEVITGRVFLESRGLTSWADAAGLDGEQVYDIAVKTKEYLKNA